LGSGGAPLRAEEKLAAACKLTPNFFENYSTAMTGVMAMFRPSDLATHAASVGQPHPLVTLQVVDDHRRPLGPGTVGQLRYRGAGRAPLVAGFGRQGADEDFWEGWYYPGEVAAIDEQGYLFVKGRMSAVISRGTAKVHPAEVESVLCGHPAVA